MIKQQRFESDDRAIRVLGDASMFCRWCAKWNDPISHKANYDAAEILDKLYYELMGETNHV